MSDSELIELYRKTHQKKMVGVLFDRYGHLVYGVCLKYLKNTDESQDAVMQIFEKLMTDLQSNDVKNFRAWLHVVARNHCLMFLRAQSRKAPNTSIDNVSYSLQYTSEVEEKMARERKIESLEDAIEILKEEQKICVKLFFIEEKCYADIVEITGFTDKQVKSYIQNGKRNLKIHLSRQDEFTTE